MLTAIISFCETWLPVFPTTSTLHNSRCCLKASAGGSVFLARGMNSAPSPRLASDQHRQRSNPWAKGAVDEVLSPNRVCLVEAAHIRPGEAGPAQHRQGLAGKHAVLFFVSVGMLFDPTMLVREPLRILMVVLIIVVAKSLLAIAIVLAFRHPIATAFRVSAGLAQIGEFSSILAGFGVAFGLLPERRDLILAGALLSIILNPLVLMAAERYAAWLQRRPAILARLERSGDPLAGARLGAAPRTGGTTPSSSGTVGLARLLAGRSPGRASRTSSSRVTAGAPDIRAQGCR
jgi:Sodium/hydrogen exchanger family